MRGQKILTLRQDACIFCAFRILGDIPAQRYLPLAPRRRFRSSTRSSQPPAAAAALKEDDDDQSSYPDQSQRIYDGQPTTPASSFGKRSWIQPASSSVAYTSQGFRLPSEGEKQDHASVPTKQSGGVTIRKHTIRDKGAYQGSPVSELRWNRQQDNLIRSVGVNGSRRLQQPERYTSQEPWNRLAERDKPQIASSPSQARTPQNHTPTRGEIGGRSRRQWQDGVLFNLGSTAGHENLSAQRPLARQEADSRQRARFGSDENVETGEAPVFRNFRPQTQTAPPPKWQCFGCGHSNFAEDTKCLSCFRTKQTLDDLETPRTLGVLPTVRQEEDAPLGLQNGWRHLRHTVAKRRQIAQEEREQRSKSGDWIGFSQPHQPTVRASSPYASPGTQERRINAERESNGQYISFKPGFQPDPEAPRPLRREPATRPVQVTEEGEEDGKIARRRSRRLRKFGDEEELEQDNDPGRRKIRNRRQASRHEEEEDEELTEDFEAARERRRRRVKEKKAKKKGEAAPIPVYLPEFISVGNLADVLKVRPEQFLQRMEALGFEGPKYDHVLDAENAGLIAAEFNFEPIFDIPVEEDLVPQPIVEDKSLLPSRPPVVTIMGHVDHGKTTILDYLRKSSVAASEFGGITQHIGAFSVAMPSGKLITFLDTPGHAAFLEMRRRGANMTDIVILVVAADDSVKPQTIEAIKHAKQAGVQIIVAINKIDKEDADPERVKRDLTQHDIVVEDFGGDIQAIQVSGKTGQGMLELEEAAVTLADVLDMRAPADGKVEGWVIEATTKLAGRVATVLVRRGTIKTGDIIVAGTTWAKVRSLKNEAGVIIDAATPGTPVEVDGWKEQPIAGDEVLQAPTEQRARTAIDIRIEKLERERLTTDMSAINEARRLAEIERERLKVEEAEAAEKDEKWHRTHDEGWKELDPNKSSIKEIPFIAKADVSGSVEAVVNSVSAIGNNEVQAHILRSGVGPISAFDVEHAAAAEGHILNFNTTIDPNIARMAEMEGVEIFNHNIIYKLVDAVKAKLSDHLEPTITKRVVGEAEIGQVFEISIKGKDKRSIAGCKIRNGVVKRDSKVRVMRDKEIIYDGTLSSLKNIKKDVTEMRKGTECGIGFENWQLFQVGDQVQCYEETTEKRFL